MEEFKFQFEKLDAWQEARKLVAKTYRLTEKFPITEQYALANQLQRAAVSVPSNIAEGSGRVAVKENIHFLEIAFGSLMEVYCQLQLAVDLGYISDEDMKSIKSDIFTTSKLISGLRKSKIKKLEENK
ncbi:MAG: four helix bundle protein [Muribaculaceae bacterium]|nr:four helix bundle protein [Muribaculaceae bacterium]